ncbi:MAG: PEGA domain-containing protein [Bacteroidales bacterium]|nr:PEGA domain-containing protein [Bacteroidales bacterium]
MKTKQFILILIFSTSLLFAGCSSTTIIQTEPSGASVYLNEKHVGTSPYEMKDKKITATCTNLKLKMPGYKTIYHSICKDEQLNPGALIGGLFVVIPYLWILEYYPVHYYVLERDANSPQLAIPPKDEPVTNPYDKTNSKVEALRELHSLMEAGIITKEEFEVEKKRILSKQY